ncbi:putative PurR-regulated permease PerM [Rubrivivax gelatinosus]|uniref:AI-2E family transporter n=3 Tax=Rubrivivax gelatinosus TaxID=28068 RepID=UPI0018CBEAF2|nr:AI-2E family transporter [Rubrivivax gelatinosus]MBG6082732.1 putative PurR-regulated permease PerM [Rubrivivax gelatinosus]
MPSPPADPPHPEESERLVALPAGLATAIAIALVVAALYLGQAILVPFALAVLLAFVLDPLVTRLRRAWLPRAAAVAIVIAATVGVLGGLSLFVGSQVAELGRDLPSYQSTIQKKLRTLRQAVVLNGGSLGGASRVVDVVEREFDAARRALHPGQPAAADAPMRVRVDPAPASPLQALADVALPVLTPLATAGVALVFLVFILIDRSDLRERLLRFAGADLRRATAAVDEAARRVSRYLTVQLGVNLGFGAALGLGLWLIGVPGALLWGVLGAVLRYVPYVGGLVAAVCPALMAFAVDDGWSLLVWTLALVLALEIVINSLIEPWLYGASAGIARVALLLSAAFWAALWGPVGLLLATPITVCLVVMGRHLRPLRFLEHLLGATPVFDAPTRLYQRLLAGDVEEAIELAEQEVRSGSLQAFLRDTGVPALQQASLAHARSGAEHRHRVVSGMAALLHELRQSSPAPAPAEGAARVLCIGLRSELDSLAAEMLALTLAAAGADARHVPAAGLSVEQIGRLPLDGVDAVVLSAFNPAPEVNARFVCRRLRRREPGLRIVLAPWNAATTLRTPEAAADLGVDHVAATLDEAALQALPPRPAGEAAPEPPRTLPAGELQVALTPVLQRAVDVFDAPVAALALRDRRCLVSPGADAALGTAASRLAAEAAAAFQHTSAAAGALPDPQQTLGGLVASVAPLLDDAGGLRGALVVARAGPRGATPGELRLLQSLAQEAARAVASSGDGEPPAPAASAALTPPGQPAPA